MIESERLCYIGNNQVKLRANKICDIQIAVGRGAIEPSSDGKRIMSYIIIFWRITIYDSKLSRRHDSLQVLLVFGSVHHYHMQSKMTSNNKIIER